MTIVAGFAMFAFAGGGATAQDAAAHPSHIHVGTCAELDPNPTYPLNDVAAVSTDAPASAVETATTSIDVSLDDLLASPYAINVHASAEDIQTYIACGDIAGPVVDGTLLVAMRAQSDSGYAGIAVLTSNDAGGTDVTVYLAPGEAAGATPVAAASQEVAVDIKDFAFAPQTIEVPVGTTVTWTNNDTTQHTVTSAGVWDSDIMEPGATFSYTFDEAGTFDYICSLHPNMTGQIVVTG
jgi:plastocyanin